MESETGADPISPPENTKSLSPRQAEVVWYVLGLAGVPFVSTVFQRGLLSRHTQNGKDLWVFNIYRVIYLYDHVWLQTTSFQGFHSHGFTGQREI